MTLDPRKPSVNFWGQTYTFDICINFKGSLIYGSDREMLLPGNMEGLASGRQASVFKGRRRVHPRGICSLRIQEGRMSSFRSGRGERRRRAIGKRRQAVGKRLEGQENIGKQLASVGKQLEERGNLLASHP